MNFYKNQKKNKKHLSPPSPEPPQIFSKISNSNFLLLTQTCLDFLLYSLEREEEEEEEPGAGFEAPAELH